MNLRKYYITLLFILVLTAASAQLIVAEGIGANVLINNMLVGDGIATRNVKYTGYDRSIALFENGISAGLDLESGVILSSGIAVGAKGPNNDGGFTSGQGGPGDAKLTALAGFKTLDAAILEFEFKAQTEDVEFRYVFGSDEFKEWVDAGFNDIFGFFISGPGISGEQNVALIPGTSTEVSIDNVNHKRNTLHYRDNVLPGSASYKYLQGDGHTVVLVATLTLQACEWYKIKLAIADVGDQEKDSWVFIESKSFKHKTLIGKDTAYCTEQFDQTLDAGHPTRTVLWSTGEKTQQIQVKAYGTYWVQVFTTCGSFKDEIKILPAIPPISIGNDTFGCGNEIDFTLEVKDRIFDSYSWSDGSRMPTLQAKSPSLYWLEVERNGCFARDSMLISSQPFPQFDLGADTLICGPLNITLDPKIANATYTWSDGSTNQSLLVTSPGNYNVYVEKAGCSFADSVYITNRKTFSFDLGPDSFQYCDVQDIVLNTGITDLKNYEITWSTGDTVGRITVNESGLYTVVVRDKHCDYEHTDQSAVNFLGSGTPYFVPNAFTPNMDDNNDVFKPFVPFTDIDSYKIVIYNRWGEQVFSSEDPNQAWDGKRNGKPAEKGVYIWHCMVKTSCLKDQLHHQRGTLTILR